MNTEKSLVEEILLAWKDWQDLFILCSARTTSASLVKMAVGAECQGNLVRREA